MVNYLLKKSYRLKDLKEVEFKDLWGDHGVFTTMWIFDNPAKILFFKDHINNLIKSTKAYSILNYKNISEISVASGVVIDSNAKHEFNENFIKAKALIDLFK